MKKNIAIAIITAALIAPSTFASTVFHNREVRQQARITQGVHSGSLTCRETARLEAQEHALVRERQLMKVTGGGLSLAERAALQQQQNQLSRRIDQQKHDGQVR